MEQARILIAIVLSFLVFLLWQIFFSPAPPVIEPIREEEIVHRPPSPDAQGQWRAPFSDSGSEESVPRAPEAEPVAAPRSMTVETPLYSLVVSSKGAVFTSLLLKGYTERVGKDAPLKQMVAVNEGVYPVHTGFAGGTVKGADTAVYQMDLAAERLIVNNEPRRLLLSWTSPEGVRVEKRFTFRPNSYVIDLSLTIRNGSGTALHDALSVIITGKVGMESGYGFEGPAALIGDSVEEIEPAKISKKNLLKGQIRWVGVQDRYFLAALIPEAEGDSSLALTMQGPEIVLARHEGPTFSLDGQGSAVFEYHLFFGPKSGAVLKGAGMELQRALNFGFFDLIAKPCLWLMNLMHEYIPNYGVAIILLTLLVKLLFWPLGNKSYKSMAAMKKLQPMMQEIRERYKDDKKKMNQEIFALYKVYKVNPMSGCLPMLLQVPVFFALYRMLYGAIELRHAPFLGWINDLSAPDRLFSFPFSVPFMHPPYGIPVLTVIMGVTMFIQQKMSPPPGDPTQAKIMLALPIIFTVIFINFPSGLVLYWLVNNVVSIAQQHYISRQSA